MSSAITIAATGLAHALVSDVPGTAPPKGVIFVLSLAGHRRAGAPRPVELHRRTRRAAQQLTFCHEPDSHTTAAEMEVNEISTCFASPSRFRECRAVDGDEGP